MSKNITLNGNNNEALKIHVTKEYLINNLEEFCNIIFEQIANYKRYNSKISSIEQQRNKHVYTFMVIIAFIIIIALIELIWWLKIVLSICTVVFLIKLSREIRKMSFDMKKIRFLMDRRKIELIFDQSDFIVYMKQHNKYTKYPKYNITSNFGFLSSVYNSGTVLFPNFAFIVDNNSLDFYIGDTLFGETYHSTKILSESMSKDHKYRRLSYQKWQWQRKDGGPDRRYSNNQLYNFYECHYLSVLSYNFEIRDKNLYTQLLNEWNIKMQSLKVQDIKENGVVSKSFNRSRQLTKKAIVSYLLNKKILFNDYGDLLEVEFNNDTYIINSSGYIENTKCSIIDLMEDM